MRLSFRFWVWYKSTFLHFLHFSASLRSPTRIQGRGGGTELEKLSCTRASIVILPEWQSKSTMGELQISKSKTTLFPYPKRSTKTPTSVHIAHADVNKVAVTWNNSSAIRQMHLARLNQSLEDAGDVGWRLVRLVHHQHTARLHRLH